MYNQKDWMAHFLLGWQHRFNNQKSFLTMSYVKQGRKVSWKWHCFGKIHYKKAGAKQVRLMNIKICAQTLEKWCRNFRWLCPGHNRIVLYGSLDLVEAWGCLKCSFPVSSGFLHLFRLSLVLSSSRGHQHPIPRKGLAACGFHTKCWKPLSTGKNLIIDQ